MRSNTLPEPNITWLTKMTSKSPLLARAMNASANCAIIRRHRLQRDRARLGPARRLAAKAVELAIARQHARLVLAHRRKNTHQQLVRVRREHDAVRRWQFQLRRDIGLRLRPDLAHHAVPFVIRQTRRVVPRFLLPLEAGVGPQVMAVRRKVQPLRRRAQRSREEPLEAHSLFLTICSSASTAPESTAARSCSPDRTRPPIRPCPACRR